MTTPKPGAMDAGPKLDALVATKVMGWIQSFGNWVTTDGKTSTGEYEDWRVEDSDCPDQGCEWPGFHPSTDITAAWKVVELVPGQFLLNKIHKGWAADFKWYDGKVSHHGFCVATSAPLAICRAALAAVEPNK